MGCDSQLRPFLHMEHLPMHLTYAQASVSGLLHCLSTVFPNDACIAPMHMQHAIVQELIAMSDTKIELYDICSLADGMWLCF